MPKTAQAKRWAVFPYPQVPNMTDTQPVPERITAALAEARKARHHADCHCRRFDHQYCNGADAVWQRAINRELDHYTRSQP
jgi:hypothetical protein